MLNEWICPNELTNSYGVPKEQSSTDCRYDVASIHITNKILVWRTA